MTGRHVATVEPPVAVLPPRHLVGGIPTGVPGESLHWERCGLCGVTDYLLHVSDPLGYEDPYVECPNCHGVT